MKQTLSTLEAANILFNDEFAGWTYGAAYALAEYLEELEEETGEEMELDRIALRCEFSEYKNALEAVDGIPDAGNTEESALEYLQCNTITIEFEGGIIVQNF